VRDNANFVPYILDDFEVVNNLIKEVEDDKDDLRNDVEQLQQDLETSIDDKRGELDELAGRVSLIEDDTVDKLWTDIDYLKDEVKKNVTIPTDLNEKWNSVRDNANMISAVIEDFEVVNDFYKTSG
jgi:chromosome segregation ATPase